MKYCTKCGNPMQDDMLFCTRCGSKSEIVGTGSGPRLNDLRSFNLVMDPAEVTWEYINDLGEVGAAELMATHDKMCQEYRTVLSAILKDGSESGAAKAAATLHALRMSEDMLLSATKMLENTDPLKRLKSDFVAAVAGGADLEFDDFPYMLEKADRSYLLVSSLNAIHVGAIARELIPSAITDNAECRQAAIGCAGRFNEMWKAMLSRLGEYPTGESDVTRAPGTGQMRQLWDAYCALTEPLSTSDLSAIDESPWVAGIRPIQQWSEYLNKPADDFANEMRRDIQSRWEGKRKREDAVYWKAHPEKLAEKGVLDEKIAALTQELEPLLKTLDEEELKASEVKIEMDELRRRIEENEGNLTIYNLPLVFRAKRRQWEREIQDWEAELAELESKIGKCRNPIADAASAVKAKEREIDAVKAEILDLKNR